MAIVQSTITFSVPFQDNSFGFNGNVMSAAEFKSRFLWGIPLCNPVTGEAYSDANMQENINAAQRYVENQLDLRIFKQYIEETKHFVRDEYMEWGFIKASWFVNTPFYITGQLNSQAVLKFPNEWVTVQRKSPKDYIFEKQMYLVPNGQGSAVSFAYNFTINNLYSFYGSRIIPEYWLLQYLTGFDIIPADIITVIGKYAAVLALPIIEMTIASAGGYTFGAASNSLGLDGMSQSTSKANGGNIFKQRIQQYTQELEKELPRLQKAYSGFVFDVM